MRILLGLTILALCATPAFAGNKGKHEKNVANLEAKLEHVFRTPDDDRRDDIDKLERQLAYNLFKLQHDN